MIRHVLLMAAATAGIIFCTLLPFLPGRYDSLAAPLSLVSQLFGVVGLLLVPVGAGWMIAEYRGRTARKRYVFGFAALVAGSLVWGILTLGASLESLALGFAALALWAYGAPKMFRRLTAIKSIAPSTRSVTAVYLGVVPLAVALIQPALSGPVSEWSRNRAIQNSTALIADIERYRVANGRYPLSLVALWPDYRPSIIGIKQYLYEPAGDAYNVLFEASTFRLGTREIVMYNPRDEHAMTAHTMDRLQLTPGQLELDQQRGHYALHNAPHPHWRYYWFD